MASRAADILHTEDQKNIFYGLVFVHLVYVSANMRLYDVNKSCRVVEGKTEMHRKERFNTDRPHSCFCIR